MSIVFFEYSENGRNGGSPLYTKMQQKNGRNGGSLLYTKMQPKTVFSSGVGRKLPHLTGEHRLLHYLFSY